MLAYFKSPSADNKRKTYKSCGEALGLHPETVMRYVSEMRRDGELVQPLKPPTNRKMRDEANAKLREQIYAAACAYKEAPFPRVGSNMKWPKKMPALIKWITSRDKLEVGFRSAIAKKLKMANKTAARMVDDLRVAHGVVMRSERKREKDE